MVVKSGFKTSEFLMTLLMMAATFLGVSQVEMGENLRLVLVAAGAIATVAYNFSRGMAKQGGAAKPQVGTVEPQAVAGAGEKVVNLTRLVEDAYFWSGQQRNWLTERGDLIPAWDILHPEQKRIYELMAEYVWTHGGGGNGGQ